MPVEVITLSGTQNDASIRSIAPITRFRARRVHGRIRTHELERIIERQRPRAIVVAHLESLDIDAHHVLRRSTLPVLLDFHNVYSRYYAQLGEEPTAHLWRSRERSALEWTTAATTCSIQEARALHALRPSARVSVAGNGIDPEEWPQRSPPSGGPPLVAFFGSLTHRPNVEGLTWLVDVVWPQIASASPDARLLVLGPGDPPIGDRERVDFLGRVENLAEVLSTVRVIAVPILKGVGARVKFVESLASGTAVVSTSVGAEGFNADEGYIRADGADAFASACICLLRNPDRALAIGGIGRRLALEQLTWRDTTAPILGFAARICPDAGQL